MDSTANQHWFLNKHEDGRVFGPLPFEQVRRWAAAALIAPHDTLLHDQRTWVKAPMFPELEMDWLVEVTSERYYGPTTIGAVQEFLRLGEIGKETFVINSCDGSRRQIKNLTDLIQLPTAPVDRTNRESGTTGEAPVASTMAINLRERISELEQSLAEERRALQESEARCRELEARFEELPQASASAPALELES
jgi:hypothetical protein